MSLSKQRGYRDRSPDKPVVGMLADDYSEWYLEFCPTGDTTRSDIAEVFFEKSQKAAREYVEMEECSRPAAWNGYTRDPESRRWMDEHFDERRAWAHSIELLWTFSDGQDVDSDALREALIRMSLRRHRQGTRRDRNEERIFSKASSIVEEKAGLDDMDEGRRESVYEDYR